MSIPVLDHATGESTTSATLDVPKRLKFCVNNQWRETSSGRYMPVYNPSIGKVMAETPCCTAREVEEAVEAAKTAFPAWSSKPVGARVQVLFRYKSILDEHLGELATLLATEMGKSLDEARGDVLKAIEVVELACAVPVTMQGRSLMQVSAGHDTVSYREPMGVFAGIAPFNFPAMIPFGWMIPLAIATGNTFVLKAASMVPQTGMRMLELLVEAGPGLRQAWLDSGLWDESVVIRQAAAESEAPDDIQVEFRRELVLGQDQRGN